MDDESTDGGSMGTAVDLYVMGAMMRSMPGIILRQDGAELWVDVNQGTLADGEAVCLQTGANNPWLYGKVVRNDPTGVLIHVDGTHSPDRREFSRVWGPLHVRFQVCTAGFELASRRWLRAGEGVGPRWQRPPLFMDFSGSGARFEARGDLECEADDRLLVGVHVPGDPTEHRLTARVVRRLDGDQVAIHFLESTPGAIAGLVDFAEKIQEQLVELLGDDDDGDSEGDDVFDDL